MRVLVRAMGSTAVFIVGLLAVRAPLCADTGTFQLFPPGSSPSPLLSPDPEEPYAIFDPPVLLSELGPASQVRLIFRIPESALSLHASESLPPPIVVNPKTPRLPEAWKPAATAIVMATTVGYQLGNSLKET